MNAILDNIDAKKRARSELEAHPMCAKITVSGPFLIIAYPCGDFPVDGLRLENTASGIMAGLPVMERHWMGAAQ